MGRSVYNPSFYIPRIHKTVSRDTIREVFENILGKDTIGRIDIEPSFYSNKRGQSFRSSWNKVIVHVNYWQPHVYNIRNALCNDECVNINCLSIIGYEGNLHGDVLKILNQMLTIKLLLRETIQYIKVVFHKKFRETVNRVVKLYIVAQKA